MKVFGNPLFALFALMGPVLMVGNNIEARRSARRGSRERLGDSRRTCLSSAPASPSTAKTPGPSG